jgi:hypothetical protein
MSGYAAVSSAALKICPSLQRGMKSRFFLGRYGNYPTVPEQFEDI